MAPELQILIINGVLLAYAYFWAYPALSDKKLSVIMTRDIAISFASLCLAGALFWGSGTAFSVILFETNWFWFTVITLFVIETPLFYWFVRKHGIDLNTFD